MRRQSPAATAHRAWWSDVCERLDAVRHSLPADLTGRLQFVAETPAGGDFFHMVLDGGRSRTGRGIIAEADTLVEVDSEAMAKIRAGRVKAAAVFRVQGRGGLFERLQAELSRVAEDKHWVKLRN